jgi:hypothetical protein
MTTTPAPIEGSALLTGVSPISIERHRFEEVRGGGNSSERKEVV